MFTVKLDLMTGLGGRQKCKGFPFLRPGTYPAGLVRVNSSRRLPPLLLTACKATGTGFSTL